MLTFVALRAKNEFMSGPASKRPRRSTQPNYVYSIISVALVLFMIGFFALVLLHAQGLVRLFQERVQVMIEIAPGTRTPDIVAFQQQLEQNDSIKTGSVVYTSKEAAADLLREDFGEDFLQVGFPNPLFDVLSFNLTAEYFNRNNLARLKNQLLSNPLVHDVYYQEGLVDEIARNVQKIGYFTLGIALLFLVEAITLLHNTIKLALYANRFLIKNMELVGASWGFISRPYFFKSIRNGLLSGMIAVSLLLLVLALAQRELPELESFQDWQLLGMLFGGLMLSGMLISGVSTWYMVNKYLRMRVDDLY